MSYYGGFYRVTDTLRRFSLHREDSSDSITAPLFKDEETTLEIPMKSYGGISGTKTPPNGRGNGNSNGRTLGKRLEKRHELMVLCRYVVDIVCALALFGIILMMIETELVLFHRTKSTDVIAFVIKIGISASTVLLLIGICVNYYVEQQIKALDAGVKDWQSVIVDSTWFYLSAELLVCSIHPFPGDLKLTYTSPEGESKKVSIDAVLSILMMARLYLIAKFAVVHSRLLTDTSTTSIGALSKIKINTVFVFKAAMTNYPNRLLVAVMLTTLVVNSWAMRTCENYYLGPDGPTTYMEVMWLIATTFLTVGYGDKIPQSYCGRYISICTGVMGVGTTALLVAVLARNLEQTRSERYVFNMVTRIQIENRRKAAAANVIKACINLWRVIKYSADDKALRRKYTDSLKTYIRQLRLANIEKAHVGEFNVGIIEVSETVNRIGDNVEKIDNRLIGLETTHDIFANRYLKIEDKLDEIKTILQTKR
ncbi:small conductance calcium-activated potassium channel protein 2-like isoform X1 [Mercenaria mercenaria]|uniref:small conductance calcium-activated potassium channel protein 2-like isoform X1 n=2 Tax=Mercenaria mercenaria TaxID=6596 RepID=UPI00234E6007|nr:small conductance calcium-activated potassium channel protein 2-like isoform X1 [Mercenaria mercenaria]